MQQFNSFCHVLYGLADGFQGSGHSFCVSTLDTIDDNRNVLKHRSSISGRSLHCVVPMTPRNLFFFIQSFKWDHCYQRNVPSYRKMHHPFLNNPKQQHETLWVYGYLGHIQYNFNTCFKFALISSMFNAHCIYSMELWSAQSPWGHWFLLSKAVDWQMV